MTLEPQLPAFAKPVTGRGRPNDAAKHDSIMHAARIDFFEIGYDAASIEGIAKRAGVSKVTIYSKFGTKSALFSAVVQAECSLMRDVLHPDMGAGIDLRDQLISFGDGMMTFLSRPEMIQFERHLAGVVEHDPAVGDLFLEAGPRQMCRWLAQLLADAAAQGLIVVEDPVLAAELLPSMIKGFADMERRFGAGEPADSALSKKRVRYAVDCFLKAHAV
jgi:TetR/AcrR family transcriptional regulator, mexJK operon transcriptional repressor